MRALYEKSIGSTRATPFLFNRYAFLGFSLLQLARGRSGSLVRTLAGLPTRRPSARSAPPDYRLLARGLRR